MEHLKICVRAEWDEEADVWVATSEDVEGLAIEAATIEDLEARLPGILTDLLELNGLPGSEDLPEIPFQIMAEKVGRIQNPCH